MEQVYDVIIIGGGPGGMSAAIYAARGRLKTLILEEKRKAGGQARTTWEMENYPGFKETTGPELMENFREHAVKFGAEFKKETVISIKPSGFWKTIKTKSGQEYKTRAVIVSTGAEPRILGIKGEKEFRGRGVSYCATCDADFYQDLDVVVVGNGNTAIEESIYLTKFVNKVTIIVIHDQGILDADKILQEQAFNNDKIEFVWSSVLEEIRGDELVDRVLVKNIKSGETTELPANGVFVFVGTVPRTEFLKGLVRLSKFNYVETTEMMETSVPGIYAVGDVRVKFLRQVITAASDGATAAVAVEKYLEQEEYWRKNVMEVAGPVLVVFWSPVNQDSLKLLGQLEAMKLAEKGLKMVKIDTYRNKLIADRYQIKEIPAVIIFEHEEEVKRIVHPNEPEIDDFIAGVVTV